MENKQSQLRNFRRRVGVSAAEVGEATGLSTTTITRIELGDVEPKLATAVRILAWTDAQAKKYRVPVAARVTPTDLLQVVNRDQP